MSWHRLIEIEHDYNSGGLGGGGVHHYRWLHVATIDKGKPRGGIVVSAVNNATFMSPTQAREYATALNEAADYFEAS